MGHKHLGAVIGNEISKQEFVKDKINEWSRTIDNITLMAESEPHLCYALFMRTLQNKWAYIMRTTRDIGSLLQPLEDKIRLFANTITGRTLSDFEREIIALPVRYGGLGILNPVSQSSRSYNNSKEYVKHLVQAIIDNEEIYESPSRYAIRK